MSKREASGHGAGTIGRAHATTIEGALLRDFAEHPRTVQAAIVAGLRLARPLGAYTAVPPVPTGTPTRPRGPLAGVPFAVKDNIDLWSTPTTVGTAFLHDNRPARSAAAVRTLVAAGALPVAKTNMHELALGVTSNNAAFGPVRNPVDSRYSAGGSSGGSAVAVATGAVPFALGTDTGGSVRIPAAFCGIVGFRPSTGRYPTEGVVRLSSTRDTIGILATTVRDVLTVDQVMHHDPHCEQPAPRPLRLGVPRELWQDLDPAVAHEARAALDVLTTSDTELVELDLGILPEAAFELGLDILNFELADLLPAFLNQTPAARGGPLSLADLADAITSSDVRDSVLDVVRHPVPESTYRRTLRVRDSLLSHRRRTFAETGIDALVYPTVVTTAPVLGQDRVLQHNGRDARLLSTIVANTTPSTLLGTPSISIPTTRSGLRGLPVGISLEALPGEDLGLLRTATTVEHLLAEASRTPPVNSTA